MAFTPETGDALVVVDVQRDFCPGGSSGRPRRRPGRAGHQPARAPVPDRGHHPRQPPARPLLLRPRTAAPGREHCVEGTPGWEPHPDLEVDPHHQVFKGRDRETDGYTGWSHELADFLAHRGATRVVVVGLALDYCVQATALDARAAGHEVLVLTDATRAVNVKPDDGERALDALRAAGVREDRAEG